MSEYTSPEPPSTREAVLKVLESQRSKIERWKTTRIKEIDREAGRELAHLERTVRALAPERGQPSAEKRSGKRPSPAAAAGTNREAILRLLEERNEPLAVGEVRRTLRISEYSTQSGLKRLVEEGKARRIGTGSATRYESRGNGPYPAAPVSPAPGGSDTAGGRVLALVQDRGYASLEELSQASGSSQDETRRICGGLVANGEIQMDRRDGRSVFVARKAA